MLKKIFFNAMYSIKFITRLDYFLNMPCYLFEHFQSSCISKLGYYVMCFFVFLFFCRMVYTWLVNSGPNVVTPNIKS